jgi:hypothetical protein
MESGLLRSHAATASHNGVPLHPAYMYWQRIECAGILGYAGWLTRQFQSETVAQVMDNESE